MSETEQTTHARTLVYAATRAVLLDAEVVPSGQLFVERSEPVQMGEALPAVFIGAGPIRLERDGGTAKFRGEFSLSVQVLARGDDGYDVAVERDEAMMLVKRALLAPGSVWARWTGETTEPRDRPKWEVLSVTESASRGRGEGAEHISSAVLELGLKIAESIVDLPEDASPPPVEVVLTTKRDAPTEDTGDEPLMTNEVTL